MKNLNATIAEGCVTWSARDYKSAIDYIYDCKSEGTSSC